MVTCTLGDKKYSVDFISGRALREMEPASKIYGKLVALSKAAVEGQDVSDEKLTIPEALDTMVKWFCIAEQKMTLLRPFWLVSMRPARPSPGGWPVKLQIQKIRLDRQKSQSALPLCLCKH